MQGEKKTLEIYFQQLINNLIKTIPSENTKINKNVQAKLIQQYQFDEIRELKFLQKSTKEEISLKHIKTYYQFSGGLCGYHATYNICAFLQWIKQEQSSLQIQNGASFWQYTLKIQKFLKQYVLANQLEKIPWRIKDIENEFERLYTNVLLNENQEFKQIVSSTENIEIDFLQLEYANGHFYHKRKQIIQFQEKFNEFVKFNKPGKTKVMALLLGVVGHFASLIAIKTDGKIQFLYCDSKNNDFLLRKEDEIMQFWIKKNQKRIKQGKKAWDYWYLQIIQSTELSMQNCLSNLANCLIGNISLYELTIERSLKEALESFKMDVQYLHNFQDELLNQYKDKNGEEIFKLLDLTINWIYTSMEYLKIIQNFYEFQQFEKVNIQDLIDLFKQLVTITKIFQQQQTKENKKRFLKIEEMYESFLLFQQ